VLAAAGHVAGRTSVAPSRQSRNISETIESSSERSPIRMIAGPFSAWSKPQRRARITPGPYSFFEACTRGSSAASLATKGSDVSASWSYTKRSQGNGTPSAWRFVQADDVLALVADENDDLDGALPHRCCPARPAGGPTGSPRRGSARGSWWPRNRGPASPSRRRGPASPRRTRRGRRSRSGRTGRGGSGPRSPGPVRGPSSIVPG
jgi:hypothetical protein